MTDTYLTLFCLVDGEHQSNAFSVKATPTDTIGALRVLIKTKKAVDFENVDANNLTLWNLEANRHRPIVLNDFESATELHPTDDVSDVFEDKPPKKTIHIIVQRPSPVHAPVPIPVRARSSTPLSDVLRPGTPLTDYEEVFNPASPYSKFLNEFVQGSHDLPVTEGSISGLPAVGKRRLKRPRKAPSLMFFDLPSPAQPGVASNQAEKILARYPGKRHLPLFGVSGCGKTRTAMGLLSRSWGLYFNAGAGDYGSSDMHTIAQDLSERPEIYLSENRKQNTNRIRYLTFGLLYARLLILEHCLSIAGSRDNFTCQRWMLLQVAASVFEDVFQALFQPIRQYLHSHVVTSTIMDIVQERFESVQQLLNGRTSSFAVHSKFLVVLDESQVLSRFSSKAFLDSDRETVRPILAPILHVFRRLERRLDGDMTCVLPCGTGMSSYQQKWAGGSSGGANLSKAENLDDKLSEMVVDFAGWTDVESISNYLELLGRGLNDEARARLACLIPPKAVLRLFRDLPGRFRPIISTIEDIIEADNPIAWEKCINERVDRLTTAFIPQPMANSDVSKKTFVDQGSMAFTEFRNVEATLKFAMATFVTQGGYLAFKGQLPRLVETAFGRIKLIDGEYHTTNDEPFALRAADNYFQMMDPDYLQYRCDQLG
ncbi:hypothetical protein BGX29_008357 [Mortierella sp. GBA35]|nr:hypothetical protein BGX29_008357 [Mortierella sp. GBA35]